MTPERALVLAFGLYQSVHVWVNGGAMLDEGARVFPAPPGGWADQTVEWARGMAIVDFVVAVASIAFVVAYFRGARWSRDLGIVVTTAFTMAAAMFTIGIIAVDAFSEDPALYLGLLLTGVSGPLLLASLLRQGGQASVGSRGATA